ncbi:hypothetical protein RND81_14G114200 [Saponaria officinalis]|uniref:F-box domain-containing protein n=1 Tax=Saponaria officinalis TaxID=3572 RepID=A0AAW1GRC6_SAPOF
MYIITELFLLSDLVSFGSVCRNWRSPFPHRLQQYIILQNMFSSKRNPMLRIPAIVHPESRNPYSLPEGQICSSSNGDVFYRSVGFLVYKLGRLCEMFIWLSLSSIDNATLSVGKGRSCCVKASTFRGIIPFSVHFTDS